MGVFGELFPGRKITDEGSEDGNAQPWRLGPIDLDRGVVQVHQVVPPDEDEAEDEPPAPQA